MRNGADQASRAFDLRAVLSALAKAEQERDEAVKRAAAMEGAAKLLLSNDGAGMGDYHSGRALMGRWSLAILTKHRVIEQAPDVLHDEIRATLAALARPGTGGVHG